MSIQFERPSQFEDANQAADWLWQQFQILEDFLNSGSRVLKLAQSNAEPEKTFDGMLVYADGTNWDPGSGEGVYAFYNSTWNYLG